MLETNQHNDILQNYFLIAEKFLKVLERVTAIEPNQSNINQLEEYYKSWIQASHKMWDNPFKISAYQYHITRYIMNSVLTPRIGHDLGSYDKRFKNSKWHNDPFFMFMKECYLIYSKYFLEAMDKSIEESSKNEKIGLVKSRFFLKQIFNAIAPNNFAFLNPDVIGKIFDTKGLNIVKGLENFLEDLEENANNFKIKTVDKAAFEVGRNIAATKGAVVYKNDLIELIRYEATTKSVHEIPILIIPPCINKYYIFDLSADNSFVKWLTEQGFQVFIISWNNPDSSFANVEFQDYVYQGPILASKFITHELKIPKINTIGYCIGGTMLAAALSYMKVINDNMINSATFLTTILDFSDAGELTILASDGLTAQALHKSEQAGYYSGADMSKTFSLMRANDLIWSFFVNNYLLGEKPKSFDLLYWNDDVTNLPAKMHNFYIKNMYQKNLLIKPNSLNIFGQPIDLALIDVPSYVLSASEDHIAPWKSTYEICKIIASPIRFVLSTSGHIAGVMNPAAKGKYSYFTNEKITTLADDWIKNATEVKGSWWLDWQQWQKNNSGEMIENIVTIKALYPAPGEYVYKKA